MPLTPHLNWPEPPRHNTEGSLEIAKESRGVGEGLQVRQKMTGGKGEEVKVSPGKGPHAGRDECQKSNYKGISFGIS